MDLGQVQDLLAEFNLLCKCNCILQIWGLLLCWVLVLVWKPAPLLLWLMAILALVRLLPWALVALLVIPLTIIVLLAIPLAIIILVPLALAFALVLDFAHYALRRAGLGAKANKGQKVSHCMYASKGVLR